MGRTIFIRGSGRSSRAEQQQQRGGQAATHRVGGVRVSLSRMIFFFSFVFVFFFFLDGDGDGDGDGGFSRPDSSAAHARVHLRGVQKPTRSDRWINNRLMHVHIYMYVYTPTLLRTHLGSGKLLPAAVCLSVYLFLSSQDKGQTEIDADRCGG